MISVIPSGSLHAIQNESLGPYMALRRKWIHFLALAPAALLAASWLPICKSWVMWLLRSSSGEVQLCEASRFKPDDSILFDDIWWESDSLAFKERLWQVRKGRVRKKFEIFWIMARVSWRRNDMFVESGEHGVHLLDDSFACCCV